MQPKIFNSQRSEIATAERSYLIWSKWSDVAHLCTTEKTLCCVSRSADAFFHKVCCKRSPRAKEIPVAYSSCLSHLKILLSHVVELDLVIFADYDCVGWAGSALKAVIVLATSPCDVSSICSKVVKLFPSSV